MIGEMSMPNLRLKGKNFLIGYNMGSVVFCKTCTSGLNGSGFTKLISARISISQNRISNTLSKMLANAARKFDNTNMANPL